MNKKLKSFYMALIIVAVMLVGVVSYSGCHSYQNTQGQKVVRLSAEATETLDTASDLAPVVQDALTGVAIAFPAVAGVLGIVAGVVGGLSGAYKKYRPELTQVQEKADIYSNTVTAIVYAIERFKESNGSDWADLKAELKEELMDKVGPEALAVIAVLIQAYQNQEVPNRRE